MARLGRALGMDVVAWTFHPEPARAAGLGVRYVALDDLLRTADVISLHVRLSPESRGLIGARELGLMKPGAILVNTARGPVVDTDALVAALESGRLAGAGLDVFDTEPLPPNHPILTCEQVVLTPHNADQTPEGMDILNAGVVDNVIAFLEGRPQNVVP
jgi:D-3-phosphoglycerate dehydrogenase